MYALVFGWIWELFQRLNCFSELEVDSCNDNPYECFACTQVGVPVFHSTSCDPDHRPEWEASAGSSLVPINAVGSKRRLKSLSRSSAGDRRPQGLFGRVLDPRSARVKRWNRVILVARGLALAVDPLFFFAMSIREGDGDSQQQPCIYVDGGFVTGIAVVRTCVDLVQTWHLWLQLRLAYVSKESMVVGCGKLVWDPRSVASHYLRSLRGFWLDAYVILPIPQTVYLLVVPKLLKEDRIQFTMSMLQLVFLLQFLPKIYHSFSLMQRMRKVTGYIFGTIWWGFCVNLIAYFLASHVSGGYWYILAIQRVASCFAKQCYRSKTYCNLALSCASKVCYLASRNNSCTGGNSSINPKLMCLDADGPFEYGLYEFALPLFSSDSVMTRILYSNLWGLMALSTMGNNLGPTSRCLEVIFSILIVLGGLMLFTMLIGNIQVYLHAVMVRRRKMQLRSRDMEWWMRRRQLPTHLKQRVRGHEYQRWEIMGGQDEMEFLRDLPEGLRRDIKRYLCLDLLKKVPLLCNLKDLVLDNICDRVKPLVYPKYEKVIQEGDPVQRMIFIVNGRVRRSQSLAKGVVASSILEPGSFLGDELLLWCLRRPILDGLPASSATFTCIEPAEAYALDAEDFRYITDHFRCHFDKNLKQKARFYSSNWRTWAAVNIQLAWRRYKAKNRGSMNNVVMENGGTGSEDMLRQCAACFLSIRPHDHLE